MGRDVLSLPSGQPAGLSLMLLRVRTLFLLFVFFSFSAAASETPNNVESAIPVEALDVTKEPMPEDIRQLEKLTGRLLFISLDEKKIDMEGRRKYFSHNGWEGYQQYVEEHKNMIRIKILKEHYETSGVSMNAMVDFIEGTQKYLKNENHTEFFTQGHFCYGVYHRYTCKDDTAQIDLLVSGDLANPDNIIIDKWSVIFLNPK
jgi:hypothetical protein